MSEPTQALLTASQMAVVSELAEAPLTSAQTPEVAQPAPEPMQAGGAGRAQRELVWWSDQLARSAVGGGLLRLLP